MLGIIPSFLLVAIWKFYLVDFCGCVFLPEDKSEKSERCVKIFIGDVRSQFQHGETLHDFGTIDMITNYHTNKKSTLKKIFHVFFLYHTFSPFLPHLTNLLFTPEPSSTKESGLQLTYTIRDLPMLEIFHHQMSFWRSNFQPSNVLVDIPALFLDNGGRWPVFFVGHGAKRWKKNAVFFGKSPRLRTAKFKDLKDIKEMHNHLTNR